MNENSPRLRLPRFLRGRHYENFLFFVLLYAAAIAAYWSIMNNTLVGDDYAEIRRLYWIPLTEIWRLFEVNAPNFVRPVPYFMYWFQYQLFGLEGWFSHLINVSFHAGSAFLCFWFLSRMGIARIVSIFIAILFLLSPLSPEAVSWSDGRFDVLVLFFILLTVGLYAIYIKNQSRAAYAGALLSTTAAFLSKESAFMLMFLMPVTDLLFATLPGNKPFTEAAFNKSFFKKSIMRLLPFIVLILALFALRYVILGGIGGYSEVKEFALPNIKVAIRTVLTLLSPLDYLESSERSITILRFYTGLLYAVSLGLVLTRWKQAPTASRRLWLFFIAFFLLFVMPTYSSFFVTGMDNCLVNSRFFYVPNLAFIALMVLGLYEFGWKSRTWKIVVTAALMILVPYYLWGLNLNNRIWERTAAISYHMTEETRRLLPDPPPNAKLYFLNIPIAEGCHFYANGIPQSLVMTYNRHDLQVYYVDPDPGFRVTYAEIKGPPPPDGFVFSYDREAGQLSLVRTPVSN